MSGQGPLGAATLGLTMSPAACVPAAGVQLTPTVLRHVAPAALARHPVAAPAPPSAGAARRGRGWWASLSGLAVLAASAGAAQRRGRRRGRGDALRLRAEPMMHAQLAKSKCPNVVMRGLDNPRALIKTNHGTLEIELFLDFMPITVSNFIDLALAGFYDGLTFHRTVPNFMIQTGCKYSRDPRSPLAGEGKPAKNTTFHMLDGSGQTVIRRNGFIPDEFTTQISNLPGTVSMANLGTQNTGSSQFFFNISQNSYLDWFDPSRTPASHPVFGQLVGNCDLVRRLSHLPSDDSMQPLKPLRMISVDIVGLDPVLERCDMERLESVEMRKRQAQQEEEKKLRQEQLEWEREQRTQGLLKKQRMGEGAKKRGLPIRSVGGYEQSQRVAPRGQEGGGRY